MEETKICCRCKKDLPATDDYFASRYDRGVKQFQSACRECQKKYRKKHYLDNKKKYIDKARKRVTDMLAWFAKLRVNLFCLKCNEKRWWVLDFHHRDPKEKDQELSILIRSASKERILKEIKKCDVLCSNCHRDFHYQNKLNGITIEEFLKNTSDE